LLSKTILLASTQITRGKLPSIITQHCVEFRNDISA